MLVSNGAQFACFEIDTLMLLVTISSADMLHVVIVKLVAVDVWSVKGQ